MSKNQKIEVEGYGEVTQDRLAKVTKFVAQADEQYKNAPLAVILRLTDSFTKPHQWRTRDPLSKNFALFCDHVWPECLDLPALQEAQSAMADVISNPTKGPDKIGRLMLSAQRGAGKSYITAGFATWTLYCNPNKAVLVVGSTAKQASEILKLMRRIIGHSPLMQHMVPNGEAGDAALYFDVANKSRATKDHSVLAAGWSSNLTGRHPDVIIWDDCETPETSTASAQKNLMTKIKESPSMVQPGGNIVFLGTPHSTNSVYNQLGELYPIVRFPCRYMDIKSMEEHSCAQWMIDQVIFNPDLVGTPVFHERFNEAMLDAKEIDLGEATFAMQYELNTELADVDRFPLKLSNLIVQDWDDPYDAPVQMLWGPSEGNRIRGLRGHGKDAAHGPSRMSTDVTAFDHKIAVLDISSTGKDQTGLAIVGRAGGNLWLLEAIGYDGDGTSQAIAKKVCDKLNQWDVNLLKIESNYGGGMATQIYTPWVQELCGPGVGIEPFRVTGNKEKRMVQTLRPVLAAHRLIVRPQALKGGFMEQMINLTPERKTLKSDDIIDAVASCVGFFTDSMAMDPERAVDRIRQEQMAQEAKDWNRNDRTWVDTAFANRLSGATRHSSEFMDPITGAAIRKDRPRSNSILNNNSILRRFGRR